MLLGWVLSMVSFTFCIFTSGCVATNVPPPDRRVSIGADLGTKVYVADARCAKGKSDYATFQANVVNNTSRDLGVEWRVVWLDEDGIAIDSLVKALSKTGAILKFSDAELQSKIFQATAQQASAKAEGGI